MSLFPNFKMYVKVRSTHHSAFRQDIGLAPEMDDMIGGVYEVAEGLSDIMHPDAIGRRDVVRVYDGEGDWWYFHMTDLELANPKDIPLWVSHHCYYHGMRKA